jgi:hypothetical protein
MILSIDLEPVIEALTDADDLLAVLTTVDAATRLGLRQDALSMLAHLEQVEELQTDEGRFYWEILTTIENFDKRIVQAASRDIGTEQMYRIPEVARKIGMSEDWTRRHFETINGVKTILSPRRRSKRSYQILLIPESVLRREMAKLVVG